MKMILKL